MSLRQTRIRRDPWDVDSRLFEMGEIKRAALLRVRDVAIGAAADATYFHAANAAGTLAYHHAIFALRYEMVGEKWFIDRPKGIEVVRNPFTSIMVAFSNVDLCCNDDHTPQPRSTKGYGAEIVGQANLFESLPSFANREDGLWLLYYLMVDERGAAELTSPVVKDGIFAACVERIYLSDGNDLDRGTRIVDDSDAIKNFDPPVIRKRA